MLMFTMQKLSIVAWLMASLLLASILFIILRGIDIAISRLVRLLVDTCSVRISKDCAQLGVYLKSV